MRGALKYNLLKGVGEWGEAQLTAYLASLSDGLYYDTTKLDRFFQESVGPTLADDIGEAMGLALDQRTWGGLTLAEVIATQPNLTPPGSWTTSYHPVQGSALGSESPPGTLNIIGDGTNAAREKQAFATVPNATYRLDCTAAGTTGNIFIGTSDGGAQIANTAFAVGVNVLYFVATATTTYLAFNKTGAVQATISAVSVRRVPGNHAQQATGNLKPTRQTTGAKFDGADDNWLTPYKNGGAGDFIVALVSVPASLPAVTLFAGSRAAWASARFFVGFNVTTGTVAAGVGSVSVGTGGLSGSISRLGTDVVVGLSADGSVVRLFDDASLVAETAQIGSIDTTVPYRIGCFNDNGGASTFFGGSVKKLVAGREQLTLARYLQIRSALLAA